MKRFSILILALLTISEAMAGGHLSGITPILRGVRLSDDQYVSHFVRLSASGDPDHSNCTGFILEGCVVAPKSCRGALETMKVFQGNKPRGGDDNAIDVVDARFLEGEAKTGVDSDLMVLKTGTPFLKASSFTIDDITKKPVQAQAGVALFAHGLKVDFVSRSIEDPEAQVRNTAIEIKGDIHAARNTVLGTWNFATSKVEGIKEDSKQFVFSASSKGDFGEVHPTDKGGLVTLLNPKGDTEIVGMVSKILDKPIPGANGNQGGVATNLVQRRAEIARFLKELNCLPAAE